MKKSNENLKRAIIAIVGCLVACAVALIFVMKGGAGPEEKVVTYEGDYGGMEVSFTYYAKGDRVYKQTSKSVVPYSMLGVSSADEAKEMLDPIISSANNIDGYSEKVEYTDDTLIEIVSVDYDAADIDELKDAGVFLFVDDTSDADFVSLEKTIKYLEENGFSKVE